MTADDERRLKQISTRFRTVAADANAAKRSALGHAEKLGYIARTAERIAEAYETPRLMNIPPGDRQLLISSGSELARATEQSVQPIAGHLAEAGVLVTQAVIIVATTATTTHMSSTTFGFDDGTPSFEPCPFLDDADARQYEDLLTKADPSLGAVYRSAYSQLYAGVYDPVRGALFQMRQLFDHFFAHIAPDKEVRRSPYWASKSEGHPDSVHRTERIRYAANRWVKAEAQRLALLQSEKIMTRSYESLNQLHKRGVLDPGRAQTAFHQMDKIIRRWIDSIDPWPPSMPTGST